MRKTILKIAAAILSASLVILSAGCAASNASTKQPDPAEVTKKVMSDIEFPEMIEVTQDRLAKYYTFDDGIVDKFSLYICSSSASASEVGVFKAKDSASVDKVKEAVETRIDDKKSVFENYGKPEEYDHIKNCVIEVKGNYVIFAVTSDNDKAKTTMESFF